jgi:hypothetical protein
MNDEEPHMSKAVALIACFLLCSVARAQDPIPADQAQTVGKQLAEVAKQIDDPQIKTDVDPEKASGLHKEKRGVLVIPNKALTHEGLTGGEKTVVPVGQIWFRGVTPSVNGQAPGRERLRAMTVKIDEADHELFVFLLGARKKDSGDLELLVYGKDKEPLVALPLKKAENGAQDLPIVLDAKVNDDDTADLTLKMLGKREAVMKVTGAPE